MRLCPSADNVWFFWTARLAETGHRRVPGRYRFLNWPASQDAALFLGNVAGSGNDEAIRGWKRNWASCPDGPPRPLGAAERRRGAPEPAGCL